MSWQNAFLAICRLPEVGPLLLSGRPAFAFARDGSRVLWANPAGCALRGVSKFEALAAQLWPERHPLRREVTSLDKMLSEKGAVARLHVGALPQALTVTGRCQRIRAEAEGVILFVAMDVMLQSPSPERLVSYVSGDAIVAAIVDESGKVVAGNPAAEAAGGAADQHVEFIEDGRRFRLYLSAASNRHEASQPPAVEPRPPKEGPPVAKRIESLAKAPEKPNVRADEAATGPLQTPRPSAETPRIRADASAEPPARAMTAGRVPRDLSRAPVRFLWQTDAADRFLFVSPGLAQVVGRSAEIVGERWQDAADRLRLDPSNRITSALAQRDTWSGLTAWWPVEGSNVRVPAELTALPVFGGDQSFQGYRGFGVLRPAEALMPAAFEARFGPASTFRKPAEQQPPYEESVGSPANVVPIRADLERPSENTRLTAQERSAFDEIAAALRDRVEISNFESFPAPARPVDAVDPAEDVSARGDQPADGGEADIGRRTPDLIPKSVERALREAVANPKSIQQGNEKGTQPGIEPPPPSDIEIRRQLREMRAILDTATDGVVVLDADGVIETVNASAEALFGADSQELQGTEFVALLTSETRQAALDYLSGLRENGVASLLNEGREVEAAAGEGSIPLFITMGRLSGGKSSRFCVVLRDITHWKRTEADLVAARQAAEATSGQKSEFLARVSHEIRTPLNAIIGFAEVMIEERFGPVENERYREYLRDIRTSGEHVVSLVNDLLDISKIEAGKLDLNFVAVPLNDLVRECIQLMQPQANRARVVLRSSLSREVPGVVADERTMRQIVLNILSNSVKFTGPGGQVIASTTLTESGEAILRIRDTGEGMSEEELVRALEPFRQINTSPLADRSGTGLGLPLTKALVEANRAALSIRSARGEGTVVTVTFPPTRVLSE